MRDYLFQITELFEKNKNAFFYKNYGFKKEHMDQRISLDKLNISVHLVIRFIGKLSLFWESTFFI